MKTPLGKVVYTANGYNVRQEIKVTEKGTTPTGYYLIYAGKHVLINPEIKDLNKVKEMVDLLEVIQLKLGYKARRDYNHKKILEHFTMTDKNGIEVGKIGFDSIEKCFDWINSQHNRRW